jgi:hypothetical protein
MELAEEGEHNRACLREGHAKVGHGELQSPQHQHLLSAHKLAFSSAVLRSRGHLALEPRANIPAFMIRLLLPAAACFRWPRAAASAAQLRDGGGGGVGADLTTRQKA